jgi:hypothetical protein
MKVWLITATAPIAGCEEHYVAYTENNPESFPDWDDTVMSIVQELWDSYSWCLHLDDEEYDSEEERDEAYDQAWEDWRCDCDVYVEESSEEEVRDNAPGGDVNALEVVYDEREDS